MSLIHLVFVFASAAVAAQTPAGAPPSAACTEWRECREQTLAAIGQGEFERAHDLAWRTVQRGPQGDPDLMLLLARAQSLFGRPQDAIVMLRRLVDRGVPLDIGADPDFERTRAMPGWSDLEAAMTRVAAAEAAAAKPADAPADPPAARPPDPPAPTPAPAPAPAPAEPGPPPTAAAPASPAAGSAEAPDASAERTVSAAMEEAIRFTADPFVPGGIAYDAVSRRFVFGDRDGRKLRVVGEGLPNATDLVGAASAGFFAVQSIEIDHKRGDLWVATADPSTGDAAIHKLQLISGRLLTIMPAPSDFTPAAIVDLAVTAAGTVLAIDNAESRVIRVRPGRSRLETVIDLDVERATSLAMGPGEGVAYVAHRDGIARVDIAGRRAAPVTAANGISLDGFERIRWHAGALVGVRVNRGGERRLVRLDLPGNGRRVRSATVYDADLPGTGAPPSITIVGDDLCFIGSATDGAAARVVHRISLKAR